MISETGLSQEDAAVLSAINQVSEIDNERINPRDRDNVRVLWFGKGRELEDAKKFIKFVKLPGYPFFAEYKRGRCWQTNNCDGAWTI